MNLRTLSTTAMLAHSGTIVNSSEVQVALGVTPFGVGVLDQVGRAHERLRHLQNQRNDRAAELKQLTAAITELAETHDDRARACHAQLTALAYGTSDPDRRAHYIRLRNLLFPIGLEIIKRSYLDEAGAAIELTGRLTQEVRDALASVPFESGTLADVVDEWIDAGQSLGRSVQTRERLTAALSRDGSSSAEVDIRAARSAWIATIRILLSALDLMDVSPQVREAVITPLQRSVETRELARRDAQANAEAEVEADAGATADADADVGTTADTEPEAEADADTEPEAEADTEPDADADTEPDADDEQYLAVSRDGRGQAAQPLRLTDRLSGLPGDGRRLSRYTHPAPPP